MALALNLLHHHDLRFFYQIDNSSLCVGVEENLVHLVFWIQGTDESSIGLNLFYKGMN
jgi:hypothetical protein